MTDRAVQLYLDAVPDGHRDIVLQLHSLILDLYPEATVDMTYKMPTYRLGDGWVALANRKQYVSLYTCGEHHIATFRSRYPDIKTGKGCINLRRRDPVPVAALQQVVRHAMQQQKHD